MEGTSLYELDACPAQHSGALAALRLLNTYNHLLTPPGPHNVMGLLTALPPTPQPAYLQPYCQHVASRNTPILTSTICENELRRRGEKRPIPQELKDEKYFERRRRNNQAAKKSRDARRIREDQPGGRVCWNKRTRRCARTCPR
ncbi:transcription factor ces-2 isoform X2 [Plodia interpunctella]|uniref:transcription factor ces-2 isoform X2 n=1 Tax=Plodia interpunctella TaxID=58824 RepID=UPI0023674439|nr:transcription factor ces-2 isoform X2 [Plodia interpunctella]